MMAWFAPRRVRLLALATVLATTCVVFSSSMVRAEEITTEVPTPAPTPAPTPIPAAEIPAQAGRTTEVLRQVDDRADARNSVTKIQEALESQNQKLDALDEQTKEHIADAAARSSLEELQKRWLREQAVLASWLNTLQGRAEDLGADLARIQEIHDLWQLTLDSADDQNLPPALVETVRSTLKRIKETTRVVNTRRSEVLTLQTEISGMESLLSPTSSAAWTWRKPSSRES